MPINQGFDASHTHIFETICLKHRNIEESKTKPSPGLNTMASKRISSIQMRIDLLTKPGTVSCLAVVPLKIGGAQQLTRNRQRMVMRSTLECIKAEPSDLVYS
ncbi:hypothetical protein IAQ61_002312 [Plenodomus lingam]|uniref:uncharacterized protein n=1 Tax=Leptosphaeria maculans TaxID=5022 RepID=UPI00331ABC4C|nr:hypothetical protein IAQ61_002312 [Plenodomus lingam]